jgi:uncharacterized repeat protein (TIGR01451 family)
MGRPGRAAGHPRDAARRGVARLLVLGFVATLLTLVQQQPAVAAIDQAFTRKFRTDDRGDIVIRGNSLMTCPAANVNCAAAKAATATGGNLNNNNYSMVYQDIDANPATASSSSATFTIPPAGSVLHARLYWSAYSVAGNGRTAPTTGVKNQLLFGRPGQAGYTTVTADAVYNSASAGGTPYLAVADVTDLVRTAGSGVYTGANIFATQGTDSYAGWALVVAVRDPSQILRNLTIFDGFGTINNSAGNTSLSIPVAGFRAPSSGTVHTRLGAVVFEGDAGLTGDQVSIVRTDNTSTVLSDALNPNNNPFNSTASDDGVAVPGRTPNHPNLFGVDEDVYESDTFLGTNATSAALQLSTGGEAFYPAVVTFAVDAYNPLVEQTMAQTPAKGPDNRMRTGDTITYTVQVQNTGNDTALSTVFADTLPTGTTYLPGSLRLDGAPLSDVGGDDVGDVTGNAVTVRLGSGATAVAGGTVLPGDPAVTVSYAVTVTGPFTAGGHIPNNSTTTYTNPVPDNLSKTSNTVDTPLDPASVNLGVTLGAAPATVQRTGSRAVTWTLGVSNTGIEPETAAVVSTVLPAGTTGITVPAPCSVSGTTVSCTVGTLASGASQSYQFDGTLAANAADPAGATATITGAGSDPDATNNTASAGVVVNTPPAAQADTDAIGAAARTRDVAVLANDSDADAGDSFSISSFTQPAYGTVTQVGNQLRYTRTDLTHSGTDAWNYTIQDTRGGTSTTTVTLTVPQAAAPAANPDSAVVPAGASADIPVLANDTDPDDLPAALTVTVTSPPSHGTTTVLPGGSVRYTPTPGYAGPDSFGYQVCDPSGFCGTTTVTVTVDNPPEAGPDDVVTPPGTPITVVVLANDTDADPGDTLGLAGVTVAPAHGTAILQGQDVRYTPTGGYLGPDTFTYRVCDTAGLCDTAIVTVTVGNAPNAVADAAVTPAGVPVDVDVDANDVDPNNLATTVTGVVTPPAHGSAVLQGNGDIRYTPAPGYFGPDTFTYRICNTSSLCDVGTVTVVVDRPPVAADDSAVTPPGMAVTIPVQANDSDPDAGATLTTTSATAPAHGAVSVAANGRDVLYTPAGGYTGTDTFGYTVCDEHGFCDTATVTVQVGTVPNAVDDSARTPQGQAVDVDVLANDIDPDGGPLGVTILTPPAHGTATVVAGNRIRYTPGAHLGQDTLTYRVCDSTGLCDDATVTLTVGRPPVAADDSSRTERNTPVGIPVLANDVDPDGAALAYQGSPTTPAHGTAAVVGGSIVYTPANNYLGPDSFGYTACDPDGFCDTATVTVTVGQAPSAVPDTVLAPAGGTVDVPVLSNDVDPDGQPLTVTVPVPPANGTATVLPSGEIRYTPAPGFTTGTDTITYVVCDPDGFCSTTTVTVTVGRPVVAANDIVPAQLGVPVTIPVQVNDVDPDGGPLTFQGPPGAPAHGTATIVGNDIVYTPAPGYTGPDSFTYTVCDAQGFCSAATVTIDVGRPPAAQPDVARTPPGTAVDVPVLANDSDPDGDALLLTSVTVPPVHGTAVVSGSAVRYTPVAGYQGTDSFTYRVCDPGGLCSETSVSVVVGRPVVAVDDAATAASGTPVDIPVLANDVDPDGGPLTFQGPPTPPAHGTAVIAGSAVRYTPVAGFTGTDTFTYVACDLEGFCDAALVTVTVGPAVAPKPPVAADDRAVTTPGTAVTADVLVNDVDPEQEALTPAIIAGPAHGTAVVTGGRVRYTPGAGFTGTDTLQYRVCDPGGLCDTATLTIAVDRPPAAANDAALTAPGTAVGVAVLANDTDADGDTLSVASVGKPGHGSAVVTGNTVRYTPAAGFTGTDTFTYRVCDPAGLCDTATVTVVVNGPPVAAADAATTPYHRSVTIPVLGNDRDPEREALTITRIAGQPRHGSVTVVNGALVYTPDDGYIGPDTVTYRICDPHGQCDEAVVTIRVTARPPIAAPDSGDVPAGSGTTIDVIGNDEDPDGRGLTDVTIIKQPAIGRAIVNADGTIRYVAPKGTKPGTVVTIGYRVCDPSGACDDSTVRVTVGGDAAGTPAGEDDGIPDALARTGSELRGIFLVALVLVIAGGALLLLGRRRDTDHREL